jgi:hypothetical protein
MDGKWKHFRGITNDIGDSQLRNNKTNNLEWTTSFQRLLLDSVEVNNLASIYPPQGSQIDNGIWTTSRYFKTNTSKNVSPQQTKDLDSATSRQTILTSTIVSTNQPVIFFSTFLTKNGRQQPTTNPPQHGPPRARKTLQQPIRV